MRVGGLVIVVLLGVAGASVAQAATITPCTAPQFATQAAATAAWANVPGKTGAERWLAGDGGWTVVHPTTCARLHIFGDSAVNNAAGQPVMPHGNAVLQTAGGLQLISGATSMVPDSTDGSIDWPGPAVVEGNRLFTFTSHISTANTPPGAWGWEDLGKDLAEFTWTGGNSLTYKGKWVTPSTGRAGQQKQADGSYKYFINWGAAIVKVGSYYYIYGTYNQQGWFGNRVYAARVPVGQLTNASAWRYHTSAGAWSAKEADAATVISEVGGPESSFSIYVEAGRIKIVSKKDGSFGTDVTRWASSSPVGPWTTEKLFDMPWVETDQTYLVSAHGDMRYADGTLPVTVSHGRGSSGSLADMWAHPERYRNSWHAVAR